MKRRTAVLISGRGSNMAALIAAARDPAFPARIDLVLSNRRDAAGLTTARLAGIRAEAIDHRDFGRDRAAHETAIDAVLRSADVEIVCLAGYMRLLTPVLVEAWRGRMLNIHPSLLPSFPGLHTHARALEAGVKLHGCTVHLVTQEMDVGPDPRAGRGAGAARRHRGGNWRNACCVRNMRSTRRLWPLSPPECLRRRRRQGPVSPIPCRGDRQCHR